MNYFNIAIVDTDECSIALINNLFYYYLAFRTIIWNE